MQILEEFRRGESPITTIHDTSRRKVHDNDMNNRTSFRKRSPILKFI